MPQLHKRFVDSQVKELFARYLKKEIERGHVQEVLGIGKSRFFALAGKFRKDPEAFSVRYIRENATHEISRDVEENIIKELSIEKALIQNPEIRLYCYNYSYIRDRLLQEYSQRVALSTIIDRAKKYGFWIHKTKRKAHDREILTNYAGELLQHDSSYHQWSPYAREKWYLITSIDDYSRLMLFAKMLKKETSLEHIKAMEMIFLKYGMPMSVYVDSHSIFRFVQGRDSIWRTHKVLTDGVPTQWEQVLMDCGVKVVHALSPQAKGKVERPYQWLQDRIVRTCARENITDITQAHGILSNELKRYNYRQLHSTTQEVPYVRFQAAKSLFRSFAIKPPFQSIKDIFCFRFQRTTNAYRRVSFNNLEFRLNADPDRVVELRIYQLNPSFSEIRFWYKNALIDVQKVKNTDLNVSSFNS
jgi:hypothetical protein